MMSIEYMQSLADEAGNKARRNKTVPRVFSATLLAQFGQRGGPTIPALGSYRPKGWRIEEHKLCDSSGFGADDEPALTQRQLKEWIGQHPGDGFAVIEIGQFQVVVGRFTKTS